MPLPVIYVTSPRGQCAILLLSALHDLYVNDGKSRVAKQEAIAHIGTHHWFALEEEDHVPYPSQRLLSREPRWHTLIAWARKDSVIHDLVSDEARDAWGLTHRGRAAIERLHSSFRSGENSARACFLWSTNFKALVQPGYLPNSDEAKRPRFFYRDNFGENMIELY